MFLFATASVEGATHHVSLQPLNGIPPGQQHRSLAEAATSVQPGDVVLIHSGIYREAVEVKNSGTRERPIRFEAAPNAKVTITGLDLVTAWEKDAGELRSFSIPWSRQFLQTSATGAYPEDERHRLIGRAEQVLIGGYPLRQVLAKGNLSPGAFFVDQDAKRLHVIPATSDDLTNPNLRVEVATRPTLWICTGAYVQVRGLRFRHAADAAHANPIVLQGRGDVLEDCVLEQMNACPVGFVAPDQVARRCTFRDNGQMGFVAVYADRLRISDCVVSGNNTRDYARDWEAGGCKIVLSRNVVIERSRFLNNRGVGIWFDIGNEDCVVRNCLIAENEDGGIYNEISYGTRLHDNVITGNGMVTGPLAWNGGSGVGVSSSPGTVLERNLILANKIGVTFADMPRTTPRIGATPGSAEVPIWNHDEAMRQNIIANNQDTQLLAWFGTADQRYWPRAMQEPREPDEVRGEEISLEQLRFHFSRNVYGFTDNQALAIWGAPGVRHMDYRSLGEFRKTMGLEAGSVRAEPEFRNSRTCDFRLRRKSAAILRCSPRGEVPGVKLDRR